MLPGLRLEHWRYPTHPEKPFFPLHAGSGASSHVEIRIWPCDFLALDTRLCLEWVDSTTVIDKAYFIHIHSLTHFVCVCDAYQEREAL